MLVIEKMFRIKVSEDSLTEDLCGMLANCHCFDKVKCKVNDSIDCYECMFFDQDERCQRRIYDWLMSEYKEGVDHENN
jgi:hypothetical protein